MKSTKMNVFRAMSLVVTLLAMVLASSWVSAEEAGPRELVQAAIERITGRIDADRARIDAEPEYARQVVREELAGLVDFKRITRLVMAQHFDAASKEQKYRFLDVFESSLINTYSAGISLYQGQPIQVLPLEEGDVKNGRARVRTEIVTNSGSVVPVYFSLYQGGDQQWLVENVIVNGLNLGKTFRAQFDQAVQQYNGDLDQVITTWSSEVNGEAPGLEAARAPATDA